MIALQDIATTAPPEAIKETTKHATKKLRKRLFELQHNMYIEGKHSLLVILQGVDTSGKDGTIRSVFSGVNPMGCRVKSFKKPTELEQKHDFLWRVFPHLPEAGKIQLFNRSYYEDILVPTLYNTVEGEALLHRYTMVNELERHLLLCNTRVIKFFLHVSKEEQWARIQSRINEPHKRWKYHPDDKKAAARYHDLLEIYDRIRSQCDNPVPWRIIPADKKWYRNYLVAKYMVEELESLNIQLP